MKKCDECGLPVIGPGATTVPAVHPACLTAWRERKWPVLKAGPLVSPSWHDALALLLHRLGDEVGGLSASLADVAALELPGDVRAAVTEALVAAEKMRRTVAEFRARLG